MKKKLLQSRKCNLPVRLLIAAVLCSLTSFVFADVLYAQGKDARDRKTTDRFREKHELRRHEGPPSFRFPQTIVRFRTINGAHNNLVGTTWGQAGGNLRRTIPNDYADGVSSPSGQDRMSPRAISNIVCEQLVSRPNTREMSSMVWQWGQFLDHDITLTETADPLEPMPIQVPSGDEHFDPFFVGGQQIMLFRSEYRHGLPVREHINSITAWIDGSNVYGSDDTTARRLRTLKDGLMKTSAGNLLPLDDEGFFLAGDVRANEQVGLTSMHILFVREHNRIASRLKVVNPALNDEQIYVRARQRVTGILQSITYNEFLPALLGPSALSRYRGYNPTLFPNISNTFSTAAYRFGHTMLDSEMLMMNNDGSEHESGNLALRDAFFNPVHIKTNGIDPYIKGLTVQRAQEIDTKLVDDVRNFLFGPPGSGGFDLASLNIQRGRDHGLQDLNSIRRRIGLRPYASFSEITKDVETQIALSDAYDSIDNVDAWVGMLAEEHVSGSSVGSTLFAMFKRQFETLRDADRFWYQNDFKGRDLEVINNTRLVHIINRNSTARVHRDLFFVPSTN